MKKTSKIMKHSLLDTSKAIEEHAITRRDAAVNMTTEDSHKDNVYSMTTGRTNLNNETITQNLAENTRDEFHSLVRIYERKLRGFARSFVDSEQDAEDIVQDTFERAYSALTRYSSEKISSLNVKAWLYTITENTAYNHLRRLRSGYRRGSASLDQLDRDALYEDDYTAIIDEADAIQQALERVSPQYRACLELQDVYGLSQREIANKLNISTGCVGAYINRGRMQFRREYQRLNRGGSAK
jgi:RNA polymerase sigma-70 factor, ECF subfamily